MKRLFDVNGMFFEDKKQAKHYRDGYTKAIPKVSIGPDHWRYGLKGIPRTHSHNARSGGHGNGFPNRK